MTKVKRVTLRQELRAVAETNLVAIKKAAAENIDIIAEHEGIDPHDLIRVISAGRHKTAEHNLVTQLANKAEAELVKLWNDQQDLDLGDNNDDKD